MPGSATGLGGKNRGAIIAALLSVYIIWGSTYLGIRIAIETIPPMLMAAARFIVGGCGLYAFLRLRGEPTPTRRQWRDASIVGGLLLFGGNGCVVIAEQWVASGLAALVVSTTPIWLVLFSAIWGQRPGKIEMFGLAVGLAGVAVLNMHGELRAQPLGAALLIFATLSWAFGSAWSRRLTLPPGLMASAAQMVAGGLIFLAAALLSGESIQAMPSARSLLALLYLIVFGSLIGFSAYLYLLRSVRPAFAGSYAYINPVVAVVLGVMFAGERIGATEVIAMIVILAGVGIVVVGGRR